jgi:hypothetical protein
MELIFDHITGKQEQQDFQHFRLRAYLDGNEEDDPLEQGWLADDVPYQGHECWYQSRSTRIELRPGLLKKPRKKELRGQPIEMLEIRPVDSMLKLTGMENLYYSFLKKKGYRDLYNPLRHIHQRDSFLVYYIDDVSNMLGFTKIKKYRWQEDVNDENFDDDMPYMTGIETHMHCSIEDIGMITMEMEIEWAAAKHCRYLYLGPGYEKSSIYKSSIPGFQWWTGQKWSKNVEQYRQACKRDSEITEIADLGAK